MGRLQDTLLIGLCLDQRGMQTKCINLKLPQKRHTASQNDAHQAHSLAADKMYEPVLGDHR